MVGGVLPSLRIPFHELCDYFVKRVATKLEEREAILQGKHTPGPAETAILHESTFHKAFLAVTAIIAAVLFAIVWARVK
jgi:hypothetical protein